MTKPITADWQLAKLIMGKPPTWQAIHGHDRIELRRIANILAAERPVLDREKIADVLYASLGDTYDCNRVWHAWSVGTMSADDFHPTDQRADEIADEIITALQSGS
ncbi:hypothetical protein LAV_00181 [Sphingobium phage Lacusarx]|uniref:Uncharacterized protein n=1 Tax=Sphingobium phage Lacusarx TaxID=1980139 RepID=A0A1W6DXG5_9CAUD|nr:hypothetical protein FDH44_gp122 [Sphingobium phage Lacusarx]ARK07556.1 hypothetical protein LAV_00181 [Sphingobium phage Lacusarx]